MALNVCFNGSAELISYSSTWTCMWCTQFQTKASSLCFRTMLRTPSSKITTWSVESSSYCSGLVGVGSTARGPVTPKYSYWSKEHRSRCYDVSSVFVNKLPNGNALWEFANDSNVCVDRFMEHPVVKRYMTTQTPQATTESLSTVYLYCCANNLPRCDTSSSPLRTQKPSTVINFGHDPCELCELCESYKL